MSVVLLVPLAGEGSRVKVLYPEPKPMIMIDNKSIIEHSMESFVKSWDKLIFIVRQEHIQNWHIDSYLKQTFGEDVIVIPCGKTSGALETVLKANSHVSPDDNVFVWCSDVRLDQRVDLSKISFDDRDGHLICFKSNSTNYSYCKTLENSEDVTEVKEKEVISEWANVGLYGFKSWRWFFGYASQMVENSDGREKHIAPVYNLMIDGGKSIKISKTEGVHIFGTLEELEFYRKVSLNRFDRNTRLGISSDHSGHALKEELKKILDLYDISYIDFGCYSEKDTDYADWTKRLPKAFENNQIQFSIVLCRTGNGQAVLINKYPFIRNAEVWDEYTTQMAIEHNAANSFSIPSKYVDSELLEKMVYKMKSSRFQGGRHSNRVMKAIGMI